MDFKDEKKYVGNMDQLFCIRRSVGMDGREKGVSLLDVRNRSGMHFTVNASRGMDIPYLDYLGQNVGYLTPCGIAGPEYFDDRGNGFLKSFAAGFLTTCGLKTIGSACSFEGKEYGLHGNLSHIPAECISYKLVEDGEAPYVRIEGTMKDSEIFGDRLKLERQICCKYRERKIILHDTVTNEGFKPARHMILYHFNIGYPILCPESELFIPTGRIVPRNSRSKEGAGCWNLIEEPDADYEEMCFYHELIPDERNCSTVAVYNPMLETGVALKISLDTLDHFVQWKMMGAGDYVMGLEPCNATIDGIDDAVKNGTVKILKPGEQVEYHISVHILHGRKEFDWIKSAV